MEASVLPRSSDLSPRPKAIGRHQLLVLNRGRKRAPNLRAADLSPDRPADRAGFRRRDRRGCCSPSSDCSLPARSGFGGRSFLAGPHEGQFVELRFIPMRMGNTENTLGSRGDGSIYASRHWVWRPRRLMEWRCAGCSAEQFAGTVWQNTSARIMIRCIDSINGKPIFGYSRSPKSRLFLTCRFPIPS